ncbi:septal ring lytic transglycosylase RlpA family protein [Actinomadura terrae]|uniref:septal ring lytic transglycosylase RlpA family protein n=1 Tax=Actinomadura terrae TaxID=604353 RepID=UPI001FA6FE5E|nr:septal ring lytic transglycosylase RlpA family protein [Actinomadura terrae]
MAVLAAGAFVLFSGDGSADSARAAQTSPQVNAPVADPPRSTPTRASRGGTRSPEPSAKPSEAPAPKESVKPKPKVRKKAKKPAKKTYKVLKSGTCTASYYWEGQMTASGEHFNPNELTAAHKTLPMGSKVRVTNTNNGRSVIVRINDRGPYAGGRCLDLSKAAMQQVGGTGAGVIPVRYQVLARD